MQPSQFIPPCLPILQPVPPSGPLWSHEVKFDGYRVQIHWSGGQVVVYSRRGADFTRRAGRSIEAAVRALPCQSCIIDGELIALGDGGAPRFAHLHGRLSKSLAVVAFDLLECDGADLRRLPLSERRGKLQGLIAVPSALVVAEAFEDPQALLAGCDQLGLEGIVSKRTDRPYRSGPSHDWIKVKTAAWRLANRDRGELFQKVEKVPAR